MSVKSENFKGKHAKKSDALSLVNEDDALIYSAKKASSQAIRSSRALGLSIKVIRDNKIISVSADDVEKVERTISKASINRSGLRKGMILDRKK
jgi:hypothetical protein